MEGVMERAFLCASAGSRNAPAFGRHPEPARSSQRAPALVMLVRSVAAAVVCILVFAGFADAQTSSGVISGRVVDSSGALIPGADVTLISDATSAQRLMISSETGDFVFVSVLPGRYTL